MKRLLGLASALFAVGLACLLPPASAWQIHHGYRGPGDIATFTAFYSLRGIDAAAAASPGTVAVVDLIRNDAATCTAYIGATGLVDFTVGTPCTGSLTVNAWNAAGATATCAASTISGTTMTKGCASGAAGAFHIGDMVTGTGVAAGTYIINPNTCGSAFGVGGNCTVNISQTVASTTLSGAPNGMRVAKWYDQISGNACTAASCDQAQATDSARPLMLPSAACTYGPLPCILGTPTSPTLQSANNITPGGTSVSILGVSARVAGTTNSTILDETNTGTGGRLTQTSAGTVNLAGNAASFNATASDGARHVLVGVVQAGAGAGVLSVDCSETTGTTNAPSTTAGKPKTFGNGGSQILLQESGFADNTAWSSGTRAALCANTRAFWGI